MSLGYRVCVVDLSTGAGYPTTPRLKMDISIQIQRAQRTLNTRIRRETSGHSIIKTLNIQKIEGLESWTRKITIHIKEKPITITADFSMEIIAKRTQSNLLQILKHHRCQYRLLYSAKLPSIIEGQRNTCHGVNRLKELMSTRPALQRILEAVLSTEE